MQRLVHELRNCITVVEEYYSKSINDVLLENEGVPNLQFNVTYFSFITELKQNYTAPKAKRVDHHMCLPLHLLLQASSNYRKTMRKLKPCKKAFSLI